MFSAFVHTIQRYFMRGWNFL